MQQYMYTRHISDELGCIPAGGKWDALYLLWYAVYALQENPGSFA